MPRSRKLGMDWFACPVDFAREPALRRPVRKYGAAAAFVYVLACCLAAREGCAFPVDDKNIRELAEVSGQSAGLVLEILTMLAEQEMFDSECFEKGYVTNVSLQTEYAMTSARRKEARVIREIWLLDRAELESISSGHPILASLDASSSPAEGGNENLLREGSAGVCGEAQGERVFERVSAGDAQRNAYAIPEERVPSERAVSSYTGDASDSDVSSVDSESSVSSGNLSLSAFRSPAITSPVTVSSTCPLSHSGKETPTVPETAAETKGNSGLRSGVNASESARLAAGTEGSAVSEETAVTPGTEGSARDPSFDAFGYLFKKIPRFMALDLENIRRLWQNMTPEQIRYAVDETVRTGNVGPGFLYAVSRRLYEGGAPYPERKSPPAANHFEFERRYTNDESGMVPDWDAPL